MINKYLVRPENPEDWVDSTKTDTELSVCLFPPVGQHDMLEVRDGIYYAGKGEPYHQHNIGSELFYLAEGEVEVTVRGKRCTIHKGDVAFIPTGVPHGLCFPNDKTVFRIFLEGMNVYQRRQNRNTIAEYYPEVWLDPDFKALFDGRNGAFPREPSVCVDVDRKEIPEVRGPDFGWSIFELPEATLRLVVGRWETRDLYEIWRVEFTKGIKVCWEKPHPEWELYQINNGSAKFRVLDEEFTAEKGNLVRIPPYTVHSFETLSDNTVIYDMGSQMRLLSLLEDRQSILTYKPEKWDDKEFRKAFLRKHNCFITYFGK